MNWLIDNYTEQVYKNVHNLETDLKTPVGKGRSHLKNVKKIWNFEI